MKPGRVKRSPQIRTSVDGGSPQRLSTLTSSIPSLLTHPAADTPLFGNPVNVIRRQSTTVLNSPTSSNVNKISVPQLPADSFNNGPNGPKAPFVPSRSIADDRAYIGVLKSDVLLVQNKLDQLLKKDSMGTSTTERALSKYRYAEDPKANSDTKLRLLELRDKKMMQLELLVNQSPSTDNCTASANSRLPSFLALVDHYQRLLHTKNGTTHSSSISAITKLNNNDSPEEEIRLQDLPSSRSSGSRGRHQSHQLPQHERRSSVGSSTTSDLIEERYQQLEKVNAQLRASVHDLKVANDNVSRERDNLLLQQLQENQKHNNSNVNTPKQTTTPSPVAAATAVSRRGANEAKQLQQKITTLESKIVELSDQAQTDQHKLQEYIDQLKAVQDDRDALFKKHSDVSTELNTLNRKLQQLETEHHTALQQKAQQAQGGAAQLRNQIEQLEAEKTALNGTINTLQQTTSTSETQHNHDMSDMRDKLADALSDLQKLSVQYNTLQLEQQESDNQWTDKLQIEKAKVSTKQSLVTHLEAKLKECEQQLELHKKKEKQLTQDEQEESSTGNGNCNLNSRGKSIRGITRGTQADQSGHWLSNEDWDDYKMMRNVYYHSIMMHQTTITELKKLIT